MKKVYLIFALLLLVPAFDSCFGCNCDFPDLTYDYSELEFYQLSSSPVAINEQFETEVLADFNLISQLNEQSISGSALMACSCITNFYPLYNITQVEVSTVPAFFDSQDPSTLINSIVEVSYYTESEEITLNLGENQQPQFSIMDNPFFTARILERPFDTSTTYDITFSITKSNGEIVESAISDVKWE